MAACLRIVAICIPPSRARCGQTHPSARTFRVQWLREVPDDFVGAVLGLFAPEFRRLGGRMFREDTPAYKPSQRLRGTVFVQAKGAGVDQFSGQQTRNESDCVENRARET